jgi:hypothetical protein
LLDTIIIFNNHFNHINNSAALLAKYGNITIQRISQARMLSNGENISVIPTEKKLQIISQNETHISIIMPCSSEVIDKSGNIFRIQSPYTLNCKKSRQFPHIEQFRTWRGQKCCEWPEIPSYMDAIRAQGNLKENDFWKWGLCQNHYIVADSCKPAEITTLERYFWKELTTGVTTYKNEEIIEHASMTITVGPHQAASYGYWCYNNNQTGKESIFLNTGSNNFLEGTNYNHSYHP